MRRNYKAWPASVVPLMVLCFGCMLFALGQGGTGREPSNANSRKNPAAPKPIPAPRKPRKRPSTAPAKSTEKLTSDKPKADDVTAPPKAGAVTPAPKPGSIVRNQLGMELVYVPRGRFMMGSNNGEPDEKPVHEVTIKEGFYMGRYEVTQAEWKQVMGANPSAFNGDRLPVERVSWDDAQSFISKLNERKDGFKYRLPSEAEWEYACRAGTTGDYAGDVNEMGWFSKGIGSKTHAVGGKRANVWGLADMHGNVSEWCADYYHENYHGAPTDGSAWLTGGETKTRVMRGGSWWRLATDLTSANRARGTQNLLFAEIGFRLVAVRTP